MTIKQELIEYPNECPRFETELVDLIATHANSLFNGECLVAKEIRTHGTSRVDVAVFTSNKVIGVEAKLQNWKQAIRQAARNRYCFDHSYIALWENAALERACGVARNFNIGVIGIGVGGVRIIQAAPLLEPEAILRDAVINRVELGA